MQRECIIVFGMRSGSSALSGFLHRLGINMGRELLEPNFDNPKGFYENKKILMFNEFKLLPALGSTWDDIKPVNWSKITYKKEELLKEAIEIVEKDYRDLEVFGIKEPRICLLFPFWEQVLRALNVNIKVIIIYRNPLETAFSLFYRDGFSLGKGMTLWAKYNLYTEFYSRNYKRIFVKFNNILSNPDDFVRRLREELNLNLSKNIDEAKSFLTGELKHYNFKISDISENVPDFIKRTALYFEDICENRADAEKLEKEFDSLREEYEKNLENYIIDAIGRRYFAQLFFDIGNGFNEKDLTRILVKPIKDTQEFELILPDTIKGLRFDPLNSRCVINLERFELIDNNGLTISLIDKIISNAHTINGSSYYFIDDDPQIYVSDEVFNNGRFVKLRVKLSYRAIGDESLKSILDYNMLKPYKEERNMTLEFTGERYISSLDSPEISYEHWHRYLYASQFVNDKVVLDIACGEGYGSYLLAKTAKKVVGVDIDEKTIRYASGKYVRGNLEFKIGSVDSIPIEGQEIFDIIVSFETIEHVSEDKQEAFLKEVKRLLKRDGLFIVSTPNKLFYSDIPNYKNEFHIKEFYLEEFKSFLLKFFRNVKLLGQKIYPVSYIWDVERDSELCVKEFKISKTEQGFRPTDEPKVILYSIAVCSNSDISEVNSSILVDLSESILKMRDDYIGNLQVRLSQTEEELVKIRAELEAERQQKQELQVRLSQTEEELVKIRAELEAEKQQKQDFQARLSQREEELVKIYLSKSWRITRPLRWLRRKLKI